MKHKKKVKILHVVGAMNRGGTETMLMNIYRNIDHEKLQFDFISYDKGEAAYDSEIESLNGKIIKLTKTNSMKQIFHAIKKHGPYDVVHAHTLFHCGIVNFAAFLAGVKIRIAHAHTTVDRSDSFLRNIYMKHMRFLIRIFSTTLLACSEEAGQYLFGKKNISKTKYSYFPNVIDYPNYLTVPKKDVKKFKLEEGLGSRIILGHIGTFKESKNHKFLLDIMTQLLKINPNIKLLLIGDGELKEQIQEKAKQTGLGNHVKLIGERDNIPTILHSMDVFVFPSIYEGLGLVLLEAQASGVPCVVSEAIQSEADLGLGLMEKISLNEGPRVWAEKINHLVGKRENNKNRIIDKFEESGFSISYGIEKLKKLYNYNVGGIDEKNLNRLF